MSVKTQQFITYKTIFGRHVSTLLRHLQARQKIDPSLSPFTVHSAP